jgi:hypothetical protein
VTRFLLRGLVAAPLAGAACGLAVGVVLVGVALSNGSPAGAYVVLGLAGWIGAMVGVVVGVPAAILLALVSPAVPEPSYAAVVGLGVAGATGFVAALVVGGAVWEGVVFCGVCAIVGAATGRVVLFGRPARVRQDQEV